MLLILSTNANCENMAYRCEMFGNVELCASTHSNGRDEQRHQLEGDLLLVPENQKKWPSLEGATTPKITNCDFRAAQLLLSGRSTPCQVAQQGNSFAEAWHKICASLVTSGNGAFACIVSYATTLIAILLE